MTKMEKRIVSMNTEIELSLKAARVNANLTQKQVAEKLGKNPMTIASWEKGKTSPSIKNLYRLCKLYGVPTGRIFLS